jgi:malonate transporter
MADALLLLPDFLLILLGYLLCRHTPLNRPVWDGAERLVYYLLFPCLLFHSIVRNPLKLGTAHARWPAAGWRWWVRASCLAYALRWLPGVDRGCTPSGAQTAFPLQPTSRWPWPSGWPAGGRGLDGGGHFGVRAAVQRGRGVAAGAPRWPGLPARTGAQPADHRHRLRAAGSLLGLRLPELASTTLSRIGAAALPLGLMAVGAGLQLGALREGPRLAAALMTIRHRCCRPGPGLLVHSWLALPVAQQAVIVAFAALPTASSAYVLAVRMGGHAGYTAGLVTVSTLIGMVAAALVAGAARGALQA